MVPVKAHNRWVILLSYFVALLLMMVPLSPPSDWLRPELVAMLVIFWVLRLPQQISILSIFLLGCVQDLLEGAPLGQHSLALMVVAYVCLLSYQRVQNYTLTRQVFVVFVLVGLHQLLINWVHSLNGTSAHHLIFLLPALVSALLWPPLSLLMDRFCRHWHVA